ncbi:MAG: hypothetical protein M1830_007892, partial [Pleopsidium flavum]
KTELLLLKDESAKARQSKAIEIQGAYDEVAALRQQLGVRTQEDKVVELTNLRDELKALKKRLASTEQSTKFEPQFIHSNLFMGAPELLPVNVFFDAEAKKNEIAKRPSRKETFGKRLANIRKERALCPHRGFHRHLPKPHGNHGEVIACDSGELITTESPKPKGLQDLGPGEEAETDVLGEKFEESCPRSFEELMGVPQSAIPCLADNQLAYRDGTRDARGRLPRAKATYKVGRNVAGQL